MLKQVNAYETADGNVFLTESDAAKHELFCQLHEIVQNTAIVHDIINSMVHLHPYATAYVNTQLDTAK